MASAPYKNIHVVINPASGKDEPVLNVINDVFHQYPDIRWSVSVTQKYGDATAQARAAAEGGAALVAGYGGDGTQHEIANGILGTSAVMGVLPGGTGNGISVTGKTSKPDDGLLEVFILDDKSLKSLIAAGERVVHLDTKTAKSFIKQGKEISIDTDPDQPVWTDGEYTGRTPISMQVMPGQLQVLVPGSKK